MLYDYYFVLIAGLDEVGRGCIVGPVIAAAVILDPAKPIDGLTDSKKLTPARREKLAHIIRENSLSWSIGRAEASEIDSINILQASLLAMCRAFSSLSIQPTKALVDGKHYPNLPCVGEAVVEGDLWVPEISAASILAKVARDSEMYYLDQMYIGYGFMQHKGYPTKLHLQNIQQLGLTPMHRKTFAPVSKLLQHK